MSKLLEQKVALVTGGSSGIGRSCALLFAREGAKVVIGDINEADGEKTVSMIRQLGGEAIFARADVSRVNDVEELVDSSIREYGRLDCACNNVGVQGDEALTADCTEENWDRVISVNLKGTWLCMKYEIQHMLKVGRGAIVNMGSVDSLVGWPNLPPYVASKHGIAGLTKAAALEYAKQGIRINAVCPGIIATAMNQKRITTSESLAKLLSYEPIGRLGTPDEVAEVVIWLCSDATSFVTGSLIVVDGGFTAQ